MNTIHKAILLAVFIASFVSQPSWVFNNFWANADFYDSIPFDVPYVVFAIVAAVLVTLTCEGVIRFVKRYL